jgi:hypothetical protein
MVVPSSRILTRATKSIRCTPSETTTTSTRTLSSTSSSSPSSNNNKTVLSSVGDWFNHISGTHEIQSLKQQVQKTSHEFDQATNELVQGRKLVDTSLQEWQHVSGQHLTLLQHKESWTSQDAQQFTTLITREVEAKRALKNAQHALHKAETAATQSQIQYMNSLRQRYQEEQLWQDHWRVLGTYGTWSLIGLNMMIFLTSQYYQNRRELRRLKEIERIIVENNNNNDKRLAETIKEQHHKVQVVNKEDTAGIDAKIDNNLSEKETTSSTAASPSEDTKETNEESTGQEEPEDRLDGNVFARCWKSVRVAFNDKANTKEADTNEEEDMQLSSSSYTKESIVESLTRVWTKAISSSKEALQSDHKLDIIKEIHAPSAILGASAMGVLVFAISIVLPSNRRG